jgi:FtsP/CotA-like multicopper oxidase with cupredoxin domain
MIDEHKEKPAMRSLAHMKKKALIVLGGLAVLAAAGSTLPASAAPVAISLCATTGTAAMPDGANIPIWGFALKDPVNGCTGVQAQLPGPTIEVNAGDVVTITVDSSNLPAGHTAKLELPGMSVDTSVVDTYTFTANRAGTFGYQSSGDNGRQMAMGLYGALVVRPASEAAGFTSGPCSSAAGSAYGNAFDKECVLVLSALDPNFNANPDTFDMHNYNATYWLINGKPLDPANPGANAIHAAANDRLLLRYVNAGYDNTTMMLVGMHEHVVGRDGYAVPNPFDADAETIPAGATEDAITTVPAFAAPGPNGFPLYNRQVHVTNGAPGTYPGGMMTFIQVP